MRTGDYGVIYDGELYITGRVKDLVIVDGRNHYPQDLEFSAQEASANLRPGFVAAFAVLGEPAARRGLRGRVLGIDVRRAGRVRAARDRRRTRPRPQGRSAGDRRRGAGHDRPAGTESWSATCCSCPRDRFRGRRAARSPGARRRPPISTRHPARRLSADGVPGCPRQYCSTARRSPIHAHPRSSPARRNLRQAGA